MKETKSTFGWIFTFAGQKKSGYIGSVCLAMAGAVFQMFPFLVMARILEKLMDGNREFIGYMMDCAVMAVFCLDVQSAVSFSIYDAVSQGNFYSIDKHS